ncbi:MAG: TetR/AcrR family transcriptional regulator [Spirochaetes bacterium]|jgi:AcrR family transcriptional regulator|nr:TetR/AcrR family transcriptional regulator [Spirochaetota bacterium]
MKIKTKKENRREQIIKAAEEVFSKKDFLNSTISDVAKQAGVSDATIYEYFTSKEELLFSIPRENIENSKNILEDHLVYIKGASNKLRGIIYHLLSYYQENSDFAAISLMILKTNRKFMETEIYNYLREYYQIIIKTIEEGIESGEFKKDISPHFVRSVILGTIEFIVVRWLMKGAPADKTKPVESVDALFDLIVDGIKLENNLRDFKCRIILEPQDAPGK